MNPPATPTAPASTGKSLPWGWIGWGLLLAALAYFVIKNVPQYFILTPESYGSYFWAKASWLFPHVLCGVIAAMIGPLQFWPRIRRDYLPFHRIAGRVYVITVLVGAIASLGMSAQVGRDSAAYAYGLTGLAFAWVSTTAMAFVAIRRKNLPQHQQWMVRSYVVTFAFVTFRLTSDLLKAGNILPPHERSAVLAWACWAVPLLVTEIALQVPAVFKGQTRSAR